MAFYESPRFPETQAQLDALIAFFRSMKGCAHGFRFKDWTDFAATSSQGR